MTKNIANGRLKWVADLSRSKWVKHNLLAALWTAHFSCVFYLFSHFLRDGGRLKWVTTVPKFFSQLRQKIFFRAWQKCPRQKSCFANFSKGMGYWKSTSRVPATVPASYTRKKFNRPENTQKNSPAAGEKYTQIFSRPRKYSLLCIPFWFLHGLKSSLSF